jgi:N-acetyl-gamma-glutamyl-phosphate reductase
MPHPVRAAIVGASGYTGEELVRALLGHPGVELAAVTSRQYAGKKIGSVLGGRARESSLVFEDLGVPEIASRAEAVFLALPHGVAAGYAVPLLEAGKTVIDLSADFRLKDAEVYREFYHAEHPAPALLRQSVYGLPEFHREELRKADLIACPGCYPTSIQLALAPALKKGWIDLERIVIHSISGVSGAGKKAEAAYLFCECNESLKAYGYPRHRHLPEIEQELGLLAGRPLRVSFTPHLAPLNRGMLTTVTAALAPGAPGEAAWQEAYASFYGQEPFVHVLAPPDVPETRRVSGTNGCEVAVRLDARTGQAVLVSAIDNLGKGAALQAVQAFNLRFGFEEGEGLRA